MSKCVGCGISLQDKDPNGEGYVSSKDFTLCERCFRISNYNENRKVINRSVDVFKQITDNDVVVYVSSLLSLDLDYIDRFKNIILVLTKKDIMPKSVKDSKIISYVKKVCNVQDIVIVSANKKYNLDVLYNKLCKIGQNRKIFFVGFTNSGKSSLINGLINLYGNSFGKITTSMYPNTTMDTIKIRLNDLDIFDTPGIVNDKSIINVLDNSELKNINSKNTIKPITFQIKGSGSIMVDNLFRVDYETEESSLIFYVSNSLNVRSISLKNELFINENIITFDNVKCKDIVIADIGFIKVTNSTNLTIRYHDNIDVKIRDNLI